MQTCTKCNLEKDDDQFSFRYKDKDIRWRVCKQCKRIIDNEYYLKSESRRSKLRTTVDIKRQENKNWFREFKSTCKCAKCGINTSCMLDFHHLDPKCKDINVSRFLDSSYSLQRIKDEIAKCIVLCSNHHREFHYLNNNEELSIENYLS